MENRSLTGPEFVRLANNFYIGSGLESHFERIQWDFRMFNYFAEHVKDLEKTYKIALCCICVNAPYWQYIIPMINGSKQFFLSGHKVDVLLWSDLPASTDKEALKKGEELTIQQTLAVTNPMHHVTYVQEIKDSFKLLEQPVDATIFPIEPIEWPMPTLMRFHTMLQQEEKLKEYDYVFYCDIDMAFVNVVGDEILGERLTAVQQPMYAVRKQWWPPYEPNTQSASYIKRPGRVTNDGGKARFMPLYFAGGFQGGKTGPWLEAMKKMKEKIDADFLKNYVPIWNDETVWNSYLFENPDDKDIFLSPSYTYPDSLINEYFVPMWGCNYQPKLKTLTKKFSFQPGAGDHTQKMMGEIQNLK